MARELATVKKEKDLMKTSMTEEEVVDLMKSSRSEEEWNTNCDKVQDACGGYPAFWYSAIILSGLCDRVGAPYGFGSGITIRSI